MRESPCGDVPLRGRSGLGWFWPKGGGAAVENSVRPPEPRFPASGKGGGAEPERGGNPPILGQIGGCVGAGDGGMIRPNHKPRCGAAPSNKEMR